MTAAKRTPGPWVTASFDIWGPKDDRSKHRNGRTLIGGVVDSHTDWRCRPSDTSEDAKQASEEAKANAAFIVEACNAHESLLAQRDALRDALRECVTDTPGAACYNTGKKTRRLEAINEIVRAALNLVDGAE